MILWHMTLCAGNILAGNESRVSYPCSARISDLVETPCQSLILGCLGASAASPQRIGSGGSLRSTPASQYTANTQPPNLTLHA